MKIHKLEISGFGPFKDKQVIDFDALTVDGIFMLEGPTGAGKSSIIDAICWVLYGTTAHESANSVKQSTSGRVRSDYVGTDEETKVVMEFSAQGSRYRIQRTPTYMATKSRGEGEKKVDASARLEFIKPTAESLTRLDDVGARVRDILGMDRVQFSQLVVLPQGDFAAFLHSSSEERRLILQSIFKTFFYEDMESFFEKKRKEHTENLRTFNFEISRHVQNLEQEAPSDCELDFDHALNLLLDPNESDSAKITLLRGLIKEMTPNIKQGSAEKIRIEKELKPINEQITRLIDSQNKIETKAEKLKTLNALKEAQEEIDTLIENLKLREKVLPVASDLENRDDAQLAVEKSEKGILDEHPEASAANISAKIKSQKLVHENLLKKTSKNENLDKLLEAAKNQLAAIENQEKAKVDLKTASLEIPKAEKEIKRLKLSIAEMKELEKNEYAHIVAKKLKAGAACPICGSKNHPKPLKSKGTFSSTKLQKLEDELDEWRQYLSEMDSLRTTANNAIKTKLPTKVSVKAEIKALENKASNAENDEWDLGEADRVLKELEKSLPFYVERERAQKEQDKFQIRIDKALHKLGLDEEDIEELFKLDPDPIQEKIQRHNADLVEVMAYLALEEIKNLPAPDAVASQLSELKESAFQKQTALEEISNLLAVANRTISSLKTAEDGIKDALTAIASANQIAEPYLNLDNWVSGKNNLSLTLSNYVLQERLEMVLERASNHLRKISHGKYEFRLNEERVGRKKIAGLGIQIMDYRAGKVRLAETLSGGETFYASLALALGLAEVVKADKGGLELGTLFIDEGFGSLSDETLNEVIDVLEELRSAERIIGIISHVEGMKTQIPLRIEVRASEEGPSTIRFATAEMQ